MNYRDRKTQKERERELVLEVVWNHEWKKAMRPHADVSLYIYIYI